VKRQVRSRRIYEIQVIEQEGNLYLLRILCQSGTYIRKLIYDVGEVLAVGATMVELRRTKVGPLTEERGLVSLHDLFDAVARLRAGDESRVRALVMPIEDAITGIKRVVIKDAAIDAICHGAMLAVPGVLSLSPGIAKGETVVLLSAKGELVAIAEAKMSTEEILGTKKGIAFPVKRVIMDQGTYPKGWKSAAEHKEAAEAESEDSEDI
jgi:H/ACA ribonucleoprotein complex subunit 4